MPVLESSCCRVVYDDLGHGAPLMLVHGFPLDGRVWRDVAELMARRYRVIVPDLPGFGRSSTAAAFTIDSLGDALLALADHLQLGRFSLAGLSMGGYVALGMVRRHPSRLASLILVDSRANADDDAGRLARDRMADTAQRQGTPAIVEQMLPRMLHPDAYASWPDVVDRVRSIMQDCPATTIAYACRAMRDRADCLPLLPQLPCPLGIICGDGDAITPPALARDLAQRRPGTRVRIIERAGHMAPVEQPEAVVEAMQQMLSEVRP
jgi:pimeloyl-ACP methyl ester carboxylesterase